MPKATKLHAKGKATSIQKSCRVEDSTSDAADPEETARQFQLELCWCIQQLERTLMEKKGTEKQLQEAWKVLTVLKNNAQPIVRKRQLMRTHFGDYRAKMAAEEKKLVKMASKIKISESPAQPKAKFLRKSAFLTTGDSSFRFDFQLAPEQVDNGNTDVREQVSTQQVENVDKNTTDSVNNERKFKFSFSDTGFRFNFKSEDT